MHCTKQEKNEKNDRFKHFGCPFFMDRKVNAQDKGLLYQSRYMINPFILSNFSELDFRIKWIQRQYRFRFFLEEAKSDKVRTTLKILT
jgi:hypothetical protein